MKLFEVACTRSFLSGSTAYEWKLVAAVSEEIYSEFLRGHPATRVHIDYINEVEDVRLARIMDWTDSHTVNAYGIQTQTVTKEEYEERSEVVRSTGKATVSKRQLRYEDE